MHWVVKVTPDASWKAWVKHWGEAEAQARSRGLLEQAGAMVEGLARRTAPRGATSQLANTHTHRVIMVGKNPVGIVGVTAPHAVVMHEGRRPGARMPPPEALYPWLRFKGAGKDPSELKGIAFVVARAIGAKGIKGRPWLRRAYEVMKPQVVDLFVQSMHH